MNGCDAVTEGRRLFHSCMIWLLGNPTIETFDSFLIITHCTDRWSDVSVWGMGIRVSYASGRMKCNRIKWSKCEWTQINLNRLSAVGDSLPSQREHFDLILCSSDECQHNHRGAHYKRLIVIITNHFLSFVLQYRVIQLSSSNLSLSMCIFFNIPSTCQFHKNHHTCSSHPLILIPFNKSDHSTLNNAFSPYLLVSLNNTSPIESNDCVFRDNEPLFDGMSQLLSKRW